MIVVLLNNELLFIVAVVAVVVASAILGNSKASTPLLPAPVWGVVLTAALPIGLILLVAILENRPETAGR